MKISVLGCGGVGGYFGGKLAAHFRTGEHEVSFIARGKHLEEIKKNGLTIHCPDTYFIAHPFSAVESVKENGKVDIIVVAVKTYDLEAALEQVKEIVSENTVIIPLVNGVEAEEILKKKFPHSKIFQGCCYLNAFVESPGHIRFRGGLAQMQIGYPDISVLAKMAEAFRKAGIDVFCTDDLSSKVWEKFIFGSVLSAIGSINNESFGEIASSHLKMVHDMMKEVFELAQVKGVVLPGGLINHLIEKISTYPLEARTSMQLDFANGKRTELETFVGYVVRAGQEHGLEMTEYKRVYSLLLKQ